MAHLAGFELPTHPSSVSLPNQYTTGKSPTHLPCPPQLYELRKSRRFVIHKFQHVPRHLPVYFIPSLVTYPSISPLFLPVTTLFHLFSDYSSVSYLFLSLTPLFTPFCALYPSNSRLSLPHLLYFTRFHAPYPSFLPLLLPFPPSPTSPTLHHFSIWNKSNQPPARIKAWYEDIVASLPTEPLSRDELSEIPRM